MKATPKLAVIVTALFAVAPGYVALAAQTPKDPTKYDCMVVVSCRVIDRSPKIPMKVPIFECLHKDKLAAGQCETDFLGRMRCKN